MNAAKFSVKPLHEAQFRSEVVSGLQGTPKRLPCKYFYDPRGSRLFNAICNLDEYYLTRTELAIMRCHAPAMAEAIGAGAMLIEYGSGNSVKTRLLLDQLRGPIAYVPIDISAKQLRISARRLARQYLALEVLPVPADFTSEFALPTPVHEALRKVVYFPGSTIGNFERAAAVDLLTNTAKTCGPDGGVLIGIDLQKDVAVVEAAYNDSRGITARFNLNLLVRINRELDANFEIEHFEHLAFYDPEQHRVDLRLVSRRNQTVRIGSQSIRFLKGEPIRTEYSHKYSIDQFVQMAREAGLALEQFWTDDRGYFAMVYMTPDCEKFLTSNGHPRQPR